MDMLIYLENKGLRPKKVSSSKGGEYASACPMCGGKDRFHCWPLEATRQGVHGTFWCRGCEASGNVITLLMEVDGLTYPEACHRLGVELKKQAYRPVSLGKSVEHGLQDSFQGRLVDFPPEIWMQRCEKIVREAHACLLKTPAQLAWLASRGIDRETAVQFSLGFLPGEPAAGFSGNKSWYVRPRKAFGLPEAEKATFGYPRGLVIPRIAVVNGASRVVSIRIRRLDSDRKHSLPDMKYHVFPGSAVVPLLWRPGYPMRKGYAVVVVESDLDGVLLASLVQKAGLPVGVLATLSDRGKPHLEAHRVLMGATRILCAHDFDQPDSKGRRAGAQAYSWWAETYPRSVRWPVPAGKDPGEAFEQKADLARWIELGLPPVLRSCCHAQGQESGPEKAGSAGNRGGQNGSPKEGGDQERGKREGACASGIPAVIGRMIEIMSRHSLAVFVREDGGGGLDYKSREFSRAPVEVQSELSEAFFSADACRFLDEAGLTGRITAARLRAQVGKN